MNDDGVVLSSGNVFADLGFEDPEEELLKAKLSRQLRAILASQSLSAGQAADLLGLAPSTVSAIVSGRTGDISIDGMVKCLDRLDYEVDLVVRRKPARPAVSAVS